MGDPRGFLKVRTRRELAERPVEERIKVVIGGGKIDGGDDFGVTMLTLHDGKIDIKTVNVDGDILLSETVDA